MPQAPSIDSRVAELLQWQSKHGPLPLPVSAILTAEDNGLIVDLETGEVTGTNWADELLAELLKERREGRP